MPEYKTFEHVSVFLRFRSFSALTVVLYIGLAPTRSLMIFRIERMSTYANLLIIGDINLHFDVATDALTNKFNYLLSVHSLIQHMCRRQRISSAT